MQFPHFEIQPNQRSLRIDNQEVVIGGRAFDVLVILAERYEQVVSKHTLLDLVWPDVVVEENNLQVQISALRKLLGAQTITTLPGRGYCLTIAPLGPAKSTPSPESVPKAAGNMPNQISKLLGRSSDVRKLTDLIGQHRLVTVTGTGGLGKTHLAKTVASMQLDAWQDGVWWLDATTVQSEGILTDLIAQTLRIGLPNQSEALAEIGRDLHTKRLLLVLDNCEHVLTAAQQVVAALLAAAPHITVLTTSQIRLKVKGECVYQLNALSVPPTNLMPEDACNYGAIALFTERVQQLDRHFYLTADTLPSVIAICQQLDGVALSIELAAARVPMLGVQGVHDRLGERLRLLGSAGIGSQSAAGAVQDRHASMRAALDWTYQLLTPEQANLFQSLSVFVGSFSLDGAKHLVCDQDLDEWTMLGLLEGLVEHSMVMIESAGTLRYRLLETHRAYALERLQATSTHAVWQQRLASAMVVLGLQLVKARATVTLWDEINNIRAAFDWAAAQQDAANHQKAIVLAVASAMLLLVSGFADEARTRLLQVEPWLDAQTPPAIAARYWQWLGRSGVHGRLATSRCVEALVKSEKLFQSLNAWRHVHACRRMRAEALVDGHQLAQAKLALLEAQAMETLDWPVADRMRRIKVQALLASQEGQDKTALRLAKEALSMAEMAGIARYVVALALDIANLHLKMGKLDEALILYRSVINQAQSQHYHRITLAETYAGYAAVLMHQNDQAGAANICLEGLPHWQTSGIFLKHGDLLAWWLARAQQPLAAARMLCATNIFFKTREIARDVIAQNHHASALEVLAVQLPAEQLQGWLADAGAQLDEHQLMRELASQLRL